MKNRIKIVLMTVLTLCVLLAGLTACGKDVTVTFSLDGEETAVTAKAGESLSVPSPEKDGYLFDGWYLTSDCTGSKLQPAGTMPESDVTYYGRFLKQSTLTLFTGEETQTYTVTEGTLLSAFLVDKEPSRDGLIFGGWYSGENLLAEDALMGKTDLSLTARWKVEYTVRLHKQNRAGIYPSTTEDETREAWLGETIDPSTLRFDHFTVDLEEGDLTPVPAEKGTVVELWLLRNTYYIYYIPNPPADLTATGATETTEALYESVTRVNENGYFVPGYRFAGWMETSDGELSSAYTVGGEVEMTEDVYLYAKWDRGYTDRFGGNDLVYIPSGEEGVAYLERAGLDEKKGTYDAETRVFVFETDAGAELKGRISRGGTFAYYGDENPGTYRLVDSYTSTEIEGKPWTLTLDEYDGAVLAISETKQYTGVYSPDAESGDFLFEGDEGTPIEYASFYFYISTYGAENKPGFAIRGEEYGVYAMASSEGAIVSMSVLDGFGMALLVTSSGQSYGYYTFTDSYTSNGEIEVQLLVSTSDGYGLGEPQIWKLFDRSAIFTDGEGNSFEYKLFSIRDEFADEFTVEVAGEAAGTLTMDGYGTGIFSKGGNTYKGSYSLDGNVLIFYYNEGNVHRTLVMSYDLEGKTLAADIGEEYGDYYQYNVRERTLYTYTLHLDGLGGATWWGIYRTETGTYTYDSETKIVTCTNSSQTMRFKLFTFDLAGREYNAYLDEVLLTYYSNSNRDQYTGAFSRENDHLTLDGYYALYNGRSYYYTLESRSGFDGMVFITLMGETDEENITLLIDTAAQTFSDVLAEVNSYNYYHFNPNTGTFTMSTSDNFDYKLTLSNDYGASLTGKKSWSADVRVVAVGTFSRKEGSLYTFHVESSDLGYTDDFEFMLGFAPNGTTHVFMVYDETVALDLHSADGTETLTGDGYGNLTYSVNGETVVKARFEMSYGLYSLITDGDEKYEFNVIDPERGIMRRANQEARLYTLFDPSGTRNQLRIVLDGNGGAELYRSDTDMDGWTTWDDEPFVTGTYEETGRANARNVKEWQFTSNFPKTFGDFKFILPDNASYICFMIYDETADGTFYADDWSILTLDGYFGYYGEASFTDASGAVHGGFYTNTDRIVVFEDEIYGTTFNLKLLDSVGMKKKFKRLGDEMGTYMSYNPLNSTIYSYPQIVLDGEGGAVLSFMGVETIEGTYERYQNKTDEYIFSYSDAGKSVEVRFRVSSSGRYLLFILHADAMDGTFKTEGNKAQLLLDGYYGAAYTDENGVRYEGYYYSYEEIPLTEGKGYLVTFLGLKEDGSSANEEDVLIQNFLIDHNYGSLVLTSEAAGSYGKYSPTMGYDENTAIFLDGLTTAYLGSYADGETTWKQGTYELDLDLGEGSFTVDGVEQKFILVSMSDSYGNSSFYYIPYEKEVFGTFKSQAGNGETLSLNGYGDGTYHELQADGSFVDHEGICYFYFSSYITDYTVVLVDTETMNEYFFKIYRDEEGNATTFKEAGSEVGDYYTCRVGSSGASVAYDEILTLDGDGKAELRRYHQTADFTYSLDETILGTYHEKSHTGSVEEGNYIVTWTFIPNESGGTSFDFQIRYVQQIFSYSMIPCFIKYDANYAGEYTCTIDDETSATLKFDGYEQATYTDKDGVVYTGIYYRDGDKIYFTAYTADGTQISSTRPRATFTLQLTDRSFTIDSDLGV